MIGEECFIYVICQDGKNCQTGPVKVGITKDPYSRIKSLQTGNHHRLSYALKLTVPNKEMAAFIESAFHSIQQENRMIGEWFDIGVSEATQIVAFYLEVALTMAINDRNLLASALERSGVSDFKKSILSGDAT